MPDATSAHGLGFRLPVEGRVTPGQAFAALPPRWAFEMLDPSDALDLDRGAWLIAEPCDGWRGDARYVLWSGEVVRLQVMGGEVLELTRGDASRETITRVEARAMVGARVLRVLRG